MLTRRTHPWAPWGVEFQGPRVSLGAIPGFPGGVFPGEHGYGNLQMATLWQFHITMGKSPLK